MVTLHVVTFGFYDLYWGYRQWFAHQATHGRRIWPLARAWFLVFYLHGLFRSIDARARAVGARPNWRPNSQAWWFIGLMFVEVAVEPFVDEDAGAIAIMLLCHVLRAFPMIAAQRVSNEAHVLAWQLLNEEAEDDTEEADETDEREPEPGADDSDDEDDVEEDDEEDGEEDDRGEGHARVMLTKSASSGSGRSSGFHGGMTGKAKGKGGLSGTIHGATGSNGGSSGSGPNVFKSKQAQDGEPNSNCKNCNCCCHKNRKNREKDRSKVICFRCDKPGHFASECPERLQKLQEGDFSEHDDSDESVF